ncbi:tripartite tricarboxylate transporter substrate binding protein [Microbaculum marinum]|uniref:Tripartite tricarboxylate transporter substrate binding protein n=1 Tax=Microbaculum marinum TaxID=1764581 RepID=A0AAW9RVI0_9HYPH
MKVIRLIGSAAALAAVALALPAATPAAAQDYPNRAVQLIIPYPPGGSDALGRKIAATMAQNTGADIVVANVPGASTQVASRMVAQAAPDGYTIYVSSPPEFVAGPAFYSNLPFDPRKDFTLISYHAQVPYLLLANTSLPVKTYEEFIAYLKEHPDEVRFGSYGALSQSDVLARRFRKETGIDFEIIPYSGGSPAFNALLAGEIHALFGTPIPTRAHIADGNMLPLAVTTTERLKLYPDAPTLQEVGIDIDDAASYGLAGPAGLPDEVVEFWNTEWTKAMNDPETKDFIESMGVQIVGSSPEYYREWLEKNTALWAQLAEDLQIEKK